MLLRVVYDDGQERMIPSYALNTLIRKKAIIAFQRSEGWVQLGEGRIRKKQLPLSGPGRRRDDNFPSQQPARG